MVIMTAMTTMVTTTTTAIIIISTLELRLQCASVTRG
ncbi:hypothetical protein ANO14919_036920 [Xylariales sp. No.14919]|nr:hypothetical protein ANO14919_036920 [Xylariales sp. No.14919]